MYHNLSVKLYLFVMKTTVISLERKMKKLSKKKKIKTKSSELYVAQMCESWEGNVIKIWKSSVSKSLSCILFF